MPYNSSEVTPWDEHFKPSPATAITTAVPPSRTPHRPLTVPYTTDATSSTLVVAVEDPDAITPYVPSNAFHASSHDSSLGSKPSTSSASLGASKDRGPSTKPRGNSISANADRKLSASEASASSSDNSKSPNVLDNSIKKGQSKRFLDFLTAKEPSNRAFEDFAEQQRRELKEKGLDWPFGVSSKCLPPEVPKVNSKWDGLPDDKRDMIKISEKQKSKERQQHRRRPSGFAEDEESEETGYVRYQSSSNSIPRSAHATRPSISSTCSTLLISSGPEAYKTCDPKSRGPRARPATGVQSIAESERGPYTDSGSPSPTLATGVNDMSSLGSLQEASSHMHATDGGCIRSDSNTAHSPELMPEIPSTPPQRLVHGRQRSIPLIVPLTSPLEEGMRNVAALAPFATDASIMRRADISSRPTTSLTKASAVSTKSAFVAGEAQEIDVASEGSDQDDAEGDLASPDYFPPRSQWSTEGSTNVITSPSSPRTEKGRRSWALPRGSSTSQNAGDASTRSPRKFKSQSIDTPEGLSRNGRNDRFLERSRGKDPPLSSPVDEPSSPSPRRHRRTLFSKK